MASPVICIRDTSIKNGQLMVSDLFPNKSQASAVIDPAPQGPRYLRVVEDGTPVVANDVVTRNVSGLTAYLLTTIDVEQGGANPTPAQAGEMSATLLKRMRNGNELTHAKINEAIISAGGQGGDFDNTGLGLGASTATVQNILSILGGANFTVSAGTSVDGSYLSVVDQASLFDSTVYAPVLDEDSSFHISRVEGFLSKAKSANLVVVYAGDGSLL
jgi:hypothetical protein